MHCVHSVFGFSVAQRDECMVLKNKSLYGLLWYIAVKYIAVQSSTLQYIAVQYSTVQYSTLQYIA